MSHCSPTQETSPTEIPALPQRSIFYISARTAAILVVFVVVFTALMAATYQATIGPIQASAQKEKLALIGEVLPPADYDNALLEDWIEIPAAKALGLSQPTRLYRARKGDQPVALVLEAAALDGYSGRIGLLLAVRADGDLAALRVTEHRETPGLGDYIDPKKDKNKAQPWIAQFNGLALGAIEAGQWRVRKDGGRIDQRAGATISARAVTNASGRAVAWAAARRDRLFAAPAGSKIEGDAP